MFFYLNDVIFLCIYMFVCLCLFLFTVCRELIATRFRASRKQRSSVGDHVIQFFEFHEIDLPEQHLVKASVLWPIMSHLLYNSSTAYHDQLKDWLALYLPHPWLPFGLVWLASCYCFTLINEHDEIQWWYYGFILDMMIYLWHLRGLGLFPEYLSVRTCSLRDHPG
jgi:hypothetical protein